MISKIAVCIKTALLLSVVASQVTLSGCTLPHAGPSYGDITSREQNQQQTPISLVMVDEAVTDLLNEDVAKSSFYDVFGDRKPDTYTVNYGDSLELYIWESAPALLFGTNSVDSDNLAVSSQKLPVQIIEDDGKVSVPFVGMISVVGKTVRQVEKDILKALENKANNPQVLVKVSDRPADKVTVIGDGQGGSSILLSPKGERVLDAIASTAGIASTFNKITVGLTRDGKTVTMPLESIIKDPKQNVYLNSGDVLVAMNQPWSYSIMGANLGSAKEINFEATGISLLQALSRAGGLNDNMADPSGVFVFRFEDKETYKKLSDAFNSANASAEGTNAKASGKSWVYPMEQVDKYSRLESIPMVYQIDLNQPVSFFSSQNFSVKNGDVIYVATASSYELSKFLRIVGLIVNPALSWGNNINKITE